MNLRAFSRALDVTRRAGVLVAVPLAVVLVVAVGAASAGGTQPTVTNQPLACTITGNNGDNLLNGTDGADVICGLGGNDVIRGNDGADVVLGGPGDDILYGGDDGDQVYGEEGNDIVNTKDGFVATNLAHGGQGTDSCRTDPEDDTAACP